MRTLTRLLRLLFLFLLPVAVVASQLEEGTEAFKQKDYQTALKLLQPLANQSNAEAEALIGAMYLHGIGVPADVSKGLALERKAAEHGSLDAQLELGIAYREGSIVKQDYSEAMKWFLKASHRGNPFAQFTIGTMYDRGEGVPKNEAEAKKWYQKSRRPPELPPEIVEGLNANPSLILYSLQPWGGPDLPEWDFHGHHVLGHLDLDQQQVKTAIKALNDAVSAGDAHSFSACIINPRHALRFTSDGNRYDILICYQCGQLEIFKNDLPLPFEGSIRGKPDVLNGLLKAAKVTLADTPAALGESYIEEAKLALKKAEEGDSKAQDVIAKLLMNGRGVKKDEAEGIQWLAKSLASTPDNPDFQTQLGRMYEDGWLLTQNYHAAMDLYQKAAAHGSTQALYQIGFLYEYGEGVAKNPAEAMKLYRQAAENGNPKAQFEIGVRYAQGQELKQDYSEALKWLQKAAAQCYPDALDWMGNMYEEGWGVAQDPIEAYFWDRLAVTYGTIYGERVSVTLTPEQSAAVDKRLAEWIATHPMPHSGRQTD